MNLRIQPIAPAQRQELLDAAVRTGLFKPAEAEMLLGGVIDGLASASLPQGHAAVSCHAGPGLAIMGWAYFAPDPYADQVWNLWWIGVTPEHHGTGAGEALLACVEQEVRSARGRILVIETSDQQPMGRARGFYAKAGYGERGRVPDFYADGEAKVIFSRRL